MRAIGQAGGIWVSVAHEADTPPHLVQLGSMTMDAQQARGLAALLRSAAAELARIERRKRKVP
jgi:hypothetical protein